MKTGLALLITSGFACTTLAATPVTIENNRLTASYDSTSGRFMLTDKAGHKTVVTEGRLLDSAVSEAKALPVRDPVFGKGRQLCVRYQDHSASLLELYPDLPFMLIRTHLHNSAATEADHSKIIAARLAIELATTPGDLRAMGTPGLTPLDGNPGSYLFLTVVDPATRRGVVAGWLTEDRGSGTLFSSIDRGRASIRAQVDYGHLYIAPGESARLETLAIGVFDDARIGQELFADAVARQYRIKLRPQASGYCTWYSNPHGGAADEKSIVELAETAARELKPFGFSFIQIDDKWQDGEERNGPARRFHRVKPDGPYPGGMEPLAKKLKDLGFTTGLWFLPFASDYLDPEFKDRQHWFMKRRDGKPYETAWGNTSLDLTQPEVQRYLREMVKTVHSWGVDYFKMDGLWTGSATEQIYVNDGYRDDHMGDNAPFHDSKKTNVEVMRDGLKLLREAAGPEVFFSGCNLSQNMRSLAGSIGLVDSMRIGPDNGQGWRDYREEIAKNDCGSIITGPVRGSRLYFMHGRLWWNDPDPCYVRASVPLKHAELITSWVAISGQFFLNSDWLPGLPSERMNLLKRTMPHHGVTARPADYFDNIMPRIWLVTQSEKKVRRDVLGLFNWESSDQSISYNAAKAGLNPARTYHVFDFWGDAPGDPFKGEFRVPVPAQSCRVLAVRPVEDHPVLVSTSRHVTQGIVDLHDEKWSGATRTLTGASRVVGKDPYQLRIAGMQSGGKSWRLVSAEVSAEDEAAGVLIGPGKARTGEEGWLRVNINSSTDLDVKWKLKFAGG